MDGLPMPRGVPACPASSHPRAVVPSSPGRAAPRARRPPPRASSSPRPSPPHARRPPASSWPTATRNGNTKKMQATRGGRRRAGWGQSTWPRRARGDDAGVDARRTTTRGTASHTMCSPLGHLPARTVDNLNDWLRLQSVDVNSQSDESPQQESPFNFCPNVQDLESITRGFSTFRGTFCGV